MKRTPIQRALRKALRPTILTPVDLVLARFGVSGREMSHLLELDESIVSTWNSRGGFIPTSETQRKVLALAKSKGVKLSATEILFGGEA